MISSATYSGHRSAHDLVPSVREGVVKTRPLERRFSAQTAVICKHLARRERRSTRRLGLC